mmetsp:Transcript_75773/g.202864  ORF Transcript_75773/g.202864 Transcript_75773/m.202864 type:complete len:723 (-) Transcript_75773:81-2249(-)
MIQPRRLAPRRRRRSPGPNAWQKHSSTATCHRAKHRFRSKVGGPASLDSTGPEWLVTAPRPLIAPMLAVFAAQCPGVESPCDVCRSLAPHIAELDVALVPLLALELGKGQQDQLHLAHVLRHPQAPRQLVVHAQVDAHVAVPRRLGRVVGRVQPVFDAQHLHLVGPEALQAARHVGHVAEHDGGAADVEQPRGVLVVRPHDLLRRPVHRLDPRPLHRAQQTRVALDLGPGGVRHRAPLRASRHREHAPRLGGPRAHLVQEDRVQHVRLEEELVQAVGGLPRLRRPHARAHRPRRRRRREGLLRHAGRLARLHLARQQPQALELVRRPPQHRAPHPVVGLTVVAHQALGLDQHAVAEGEEDHASHEDDGARGVEHGQELGEGVVHQGGLHHLGRDVQDPVDQEDADEVALERAHAHAEPEDGEEHHEEDHGLDLEAAGEVVDGQHGEYDGEHEEVGRPHPHGIHLPLGHAEHRDGEPPEARHEVVADELEVPPPVEHVGHRQLGAVPDEAEAVERGARQELDQARVAVEPPVGRAHGRRGPRRGVDPLHRPPPGAPTGGAVGEGEVVAVCWLGRPREAEHGLEASQLEHGQVGADPAISVEQAEAGHRGPARAGLAPAAVRVGHGHPHRDVVLPGPHEDVLVADGQVGEGPVEEVDAPPEAHELELPLGEHRGGRHAGEDHAVRVGALQVGPVVPDAGREVPAGLRRADPAHRLHRLEDLPLE